MRNNASIFLRQQIWFFSRLCVIAIFASVAASAATGAVPVWIGPDTGGDFQSGANWTTSNPPLADDLAIINSVNGTLTYSSSTALMKHTFFQGPDITTTLDIGTGQTHSTTDLVVVGSDGMSNQDLEVVSGTLNVGTILIIGSDSFADNSDVTISGANTILRTSTRGINSGGVLVGVTGQIPSLTIEQGAKLIDTNVAAGLVAVGLQGTNNGLLTVTDPGSSISTLNALQVGSNNDLNRPDMVNNQAKVLNGGSITANRMQVGILESGKQNTVTVSGTGSVIMLTGAGAQAPIGWRSVDNTLIVENNGLIDGNNQFVMGLEATSTGNAISILSDGRINGTNFDVRRGALTITNGSIHLKQFFNNTTMMNDGGRLLANTGATGTIAFNSGTIEAVGAEISNGAAFTVGNGSANSANYRMVKGTAGQNGTHTFADGLALAANGILAGDGNIVGNVTGSAGAKAQVGASPGIINVTGNWNNTGVGIALELDNLATSVVPGVQFDQLNVSGQFTHGGTVTIDRSELIAPASSQQVKLIGWGNQAGLATSTAVSFLGGSPLTVNFQNDGLYVTVEPTAAGIAGDYNNNGVVDAADYVVWRDNVNTNNTLPNNSLPGPIGQAHYDQWQANFGKPPGTAASLHAAAVPEPAAWILCAVAAMRLFCQRRVYVKD